MTQILNQNTAKCKAEQSLYAEWIALGVRPELIRGLTNPEIRILLRLFRRVRVRRLQAHIWRAAA